MKHVLLIHYHFLPVHNVAVGQLMRHAQQLPAFGWRPLVLTKAWHGIDEADASWGLSWEPELERESGCAIHRVPEPPGAPPRRAAPAAPPPARPGARVGLRGLADRGAAELGRLQRMLCGDYPDEFVSWVRPAVAAGLELARRERIDLIMSYCPPETNHLVGRQLARRLRVPWVPFFGDLYGFFGGRFHPLAPEGYLRRAYHQWCLAPAAACAAVSPYMVDYLARTYRKPVELVLAGCDPIGADDPADAPVTASRLIVSHIGSVYPGDQRPELFFDGLDAFLERHPDVEAQLEVRFVGSKCEDRLRAMLAGRRAARVCRLRPKVDSATALSLVRDSHALLAFTCTAHRDRHGTMSYPTKIFEALSARRPTLAIPADGDWVDALLSRTHGGASARDADAVAAQLWEWFSCWRREGRVPFQGKPEEIDALSRIRQVERLARCFDSACRA